LDWITLAIRGCINDALGDYLVNDGRLSLVVQLFAGPVECVAQDLGYLVIKDGTALSDKRQNRCQDSAPLKRAISHAFQNRPVPAVPIAAA
jgi:hypothetical protein